MSQAGPPPLTPPAPTAAIAPAWQAGLQAWLKAHQSYPALARRRGEDGVALVRVTVRRDGHVENAAILHPSGSATQHYRDGADPLRTEDVISKQVRKQALLF